MNTAVLILTNITGIVVLSVGAVIKTAYYNYEDFLDDSFFSVPSLLIAIGAIVIIVSFFGCCGSVKENHCMVITFSVFLIFIFILELSAGIAGYVLKNNAEQFIVDKLNETMNKYNNSTEITKAWDELQTEMTCCGIHSASDWSPKAPTTLPTNVSEAPILNLPMSCCSPVNGMWGSVNCTEDSPNLYKVGCLNKLGLFAKEHAVTLGGVGIGIAFLQGKLKGAAPQPPDWTLLDMTGVQCDFPYNAPLRPDSTGLDIICRPESGRVRSQLEN
uniref:Tetraspanin n=1 Tax=Timema monikensis TaxID=170555 RepID=A0A7R9EGJ4_9NEOP|nr:unnamed protein product [Timema monikensis]